VDHHQVGEFWEGNAEVRTKLSRLGYNVSRDEITLPGFLNLLPEVAGLSRLDIGCGEGQSTRLIARRGATMTGVDIAPTFIRLAREDEEREPLGIDYQVASALELPFPHRTFDFVVAFMSLMDIPDLGGALREAFRVLRQGGFLQLAVTHPCFDHPQRGWVRDGAGRKLAYQRSDYFSNVEGRVDEWLFSATPPEVQHGLAKLKTPKFFRTLSTWVNAFLAARFSLERMDEPCASEDTVRRFPSFAGCRLVPVWFMMRCRKPGSPTACDPNVTSP
jgi:ubiquinone/menaquinone biosynthesis C-methylase UbiE